MTQFKDLIFKDHTYMINAHHVFDNDWEISVSAGNGIYCSPKKNLKNQESFSSFEIAIFNEKGGCERRHTNYEFR